MTNKNQLFAILLIVVVLLRFCFLYADPPYGIVSTDGDLVTDEGWYAKGAILFLNFGEWINPHDNNFQLAVPLHTLILTAAFNFFGISLLIARLISILAFCLSLWLFFKILRINFSSSSSLAGCALIALGIDNFAFSRLALVEPMVVFLTLSALSLWIFFPKSGAACLASMIFACLAFLDKLLYFYVPALVALLWLIDLWQLRQKGQHKQALVIFSIIFSTLCATAVVVLALKHHFPKDWRQLSDHSQLVMFSWRHPKGILNVLQTGKALFTRVECIIPLTVTIFGLLYFAIRGSQETKASSKRPLHAMVLWTLFGVLALGLNYYQPQRYFYFFIFPLAYFTVAILKKTTLEWALGFVVLAQALLQLSFYYKWYTLPKKPSYVFIAQDIAKQITHEKKPQVVLMGDPSAFISFFNPTIRPVSTAFTEENSICDRIQAWDPDYFFTDKDYVNTCNAPTNIELIKKYNLMNGYYGNDYSLHRKLKKQK